ncbi:hypothetical protein L7F22_043841 [Adiantum nelumboides]|nr:hypothetical protein [Adiantum nelumboides]
MVNFPTFKIERWMDKYEKKVKYDLAESCALSINLRELIELSKLDGEPPLEQSFIFEESLGYGHINGSTKLRSRIAECYKASSGITKENVLVTQGAIGANFLSILGLIQQGDHVVVVSPSYQQLQELPKVFGADVSLWKLKPEERWEHRIEELERLLTKKTTLLIINNPNNPTGSSIDTSRLKAICALVRERASEDAMILCDEVYSPLWHSVQEDEQVPPSILELGFDNVLVTGSLSKAYALAGIRVGWIATHRKGLLKKFLDIRDYNTISISAIDDELAARALGPKAKAKLLARNIELARLNRGILSDWIEGTEGVHWVPAKGGNTALVYLGDGINDEEFCASLCETKGVNIAPAGLCFGCHGYARIGYVGNTEQLKEGLQHIAKHLESWAPSCE